MQINPELQETYKEYYSGKEKEWRMMGALTKAKNISELASGFKYSKLIEIGAGEGSILECISKTNLASELYALEISESGINIIKQRNIPNLKEVKIFNGYDIPYPDKYFDVAVCSHVIEHVEHPRLLLREIKRISKKQIFEVPIDFSFNVDRKADHYIAYGHINIYNPALFKFLLISEKFKIIREKNSMYPIQTMLTGKKSIIVKTAVIAKWSLWSIFKPLKKIKPNTYTVLTE